MTSFTDSSTQSAPLSATSDYPEVDSPQCLDSPISVLTSQSAGQSESKKENYRPDASRSNLGTPSSTSYPSFQYNASLHSIDTNTPQTHQTVTTQCAGSPSTDLRVQTNVGSSAERYHIVKSSIANAFEIRNGPSSSPSNLPARTPSLKSAALSASLYSKGSLSPASVASSPGTGPFLDITPLPSPIGTGLSPGPWVKMPGHPEISPPSSTYGLSMNDENSETISFTRNSEKKRKGYQNLHLGPHRVLVNDAQITAANEAAYGRNRSLSEYVPEGVQLPRSRGIAVSSCQTPTTIEPPSLQHMHREEYLAIQRGISALPTPRPPTPPRSNRSATDSSDLESPPTSPRPYRGALPLHYEAHTLRDGRLKRWTALRQLGQGTFSKVMLATSENTPHVEWTPKMEGMLDPTSLVAVKICEHGPAGGADEKKIESSLKRELEILKAVYHPSLVHLKAVTVLDKRTYLVLGYCSGGDLFELASLKLDLLVPSLVRRIFAELVAAVLFLHRQYIVHRDIKLENVLVNLRSAILPTISDWQTYPHPIVTLTDLGLGRRIPAPPDSPLLHTRCGSEDYAAPELLMGQEYDGRSTDGWALGVLLYALMEGRLPFDPLPSSAASHRRQKPTSHRIAQCDWSWVKWGDGEGEWDSEKGKKELEGGRECVEALLKRSRSRWPLEKVEATAWVMGGVAVEGGLQRVEDEDGE